MDLDDALDQLDAIHAHLARAESYRGYRPLALGLSGVSGLAAAWAQAWAVPPGDPVAFVRFWLLVAAGCAVVAGGPTALAYFTREDEFARRRTRTVLGQFLPCLLVGGALTLAASRGGDVSLLPGTWALVFGLGAVASLPYLPRMVGWVAAWYVASGLLLLLLPGEPVPSGWAVGVPFGFGQLLSALALKRGGHDIP